MKQYKITASDFVTPGESSESDAIMDLEDLANIKKEAGINDFLKAQITQRLSQDTLHENLITLVREQKFDGKDTGNL